MDKLIRLTKALKSEIKKRLPYILLIIGAVFTVQFIRQGYQTAEGVKVAKDNSATSKLLLQKVASLSAENKKLSVQNNKLAHQNAAHIDCIANIFAQFTRDQQPIAMIDLDVCHASYGALALTKTPEPSTPKASQNKNPPTPRNQNSSAAQNNTDTKTPAAPGTKPVQVLGVPLCLIVAPICVAQGAQ